MALQPQVVDIPLLLPNQTPPKHAGPFGRLTSMVDAQIKHFLPSSQQQPQRIEVLPRDGFTALTAACRDALSGAPIITPDWNNPELLSAFGNQLVSICDSIPRVNNGASWTYYGNQRVVTNQLSESVLHTTNHVLSASDSAYAGGVTCSVWTETFNNGGVTAQASKVGFRADDGAWLVAPQTLFQINSNNALVRVVTDGANFWVVFNSGNRICVFVYDTHGAFLASDSTTIVLNWAALPGYWDIIAPGGTAPSVVLTQPHANTTTGTDVGFDTWQLSLSGSTVVITANGTVTAGHCSGPVAWSQNDLGNGFVYAITVGTANHVYMYELSTAGAKLKEYDFGAVLAGSGIPDSMTGWVEANAGGVIAHVAYSLLSNFSAPSGSQPNDPGLRYTRSYASTRAGVVTQTNQVNGVLLSSRAFRIDNDWYAATYYQSGAGTNSSTVNSFHPANPTDYFTGASLQPVTVATGDFATGASGVPIGDGWAFPTQGIGVIPHNAGDQITAPGSLNFLAGLFAGTGSAVFALSGLSASAAGSILHLSGCANAQNNGDWWVTGVVSNSTINTELISLQGNAMVIEAFGAGVTASLTQVWALQVPIGAGIPYGGNVAYPDIGVVARFSNGTATIAGGTGANVPLNGSYNIFRIYENTNWAPGFTALPISGTVLLLTKTSGAAGVAGVYYVFGPVTASSSVTIGPALANAWGLAGLQTEHDTRAGVGFNLVVTGAHQGGNNGIFAETANPMPSAPYGLFVDVTGSQSLQRAELFSATVGLPTITRALTDPAQVYLWHIQAITFDQSYLGASLVLSAAGSGTGTPKDEDNGNYQIVSLVPSDPHAVIARPVDGRTGQRFLNFAGTETISITKAASAGQPAYQPCWFLTPLSLPQAVAGRWEWAIAYADWRQDSKTPLNLGTFERNPYPLALSSVVTGAAGKQLCLPYRAQSFTAGQTVTNSFGGIIGVQSTAESTIGLKLFTLGSAPGLAVVNSGEMLLPGAQAGEFTASGFTEDGINLGPEKPYLISQANTGGLAMTVGSSPQYVVVFEVTSENGDKSFSVPSPPLNVNLSGSNNSVTIGGRMPGPTLRTVGVAIYRTANTGTQTIQHYKVTNDLDVNGAGFVFSSANGGSTPDTWQYTDVSVDQNLLTAQTLYTDQGFLARFPAPANRGGVASWQNRTWVIGYDGAIWMSGDKDEGDATWFHPVFRYVLPTDDKPVALAAMENYLLVFCSQSIWFIPAVQFPDNTGANGTLPTPQPLPFRNGCTGFAVTVTGGVAYASTAGGIWLINRQLNNVYLSQPMQDDLPPLAVTGLTVDGQQRLIVSTNSNFIYAYDQLSQAWLKWRIGSFGTVASVVTTWQGNATYEDAGRVRQLVPGSFADVTDGVLTGVAPNVTLAIVSLGAVKAMKRVWAINLTGQQLGQCNLHAQLQYPDEGTAFNTNFGPFALGSGPLNVEINPLIEETTSFVLLVFADFAGVPTPGASYSLELITAEVGIEPTMSKVPVSRRLPGS